MEKSKKKHTQTIDDQIDYEHRKRKWNSVCGAWAIFEAWHEIASNCFVRANKSLKSKF